MTSSSSQKTFRSMPMESACRPAELDVLRIATTVKRLDSTAVQILSVLPAIGSFALSAGRVAVDVVIRRLISVNCLIFDF